MIGQGCFPHTPPLRRNPMKRLFTLIPVLVFCLLCAPAVLADTVETTYLDQNGNLTSQSATPVTDAQNDVTWTDGWYVVQNDVNITGNITVTGDVKLILEDSRKLTVDGSIAVNKGNSFTVYSQSIDTNIMGELDVTTQNASHYAAIGGGSGNDAGTVNIYGGNVDATSKGPGAAIGGAYKQSGDAGTVNIYGGNVTATTGGAGAAIGGGYQGNGGIVTISGGTVSATNYGNGAAIGGSQEGQGCTVTISGGNVIATIYHGNGAAIGSGYQGNGGTVNISGGNVTATNEYGNGAAIGSGEDCQGSTVTISGGNVTAFGGVSSALDGNVTLDPAGQRFMVIAGESADTAIQLEGSPFTESKDITNLVKGQKWFHCELMQKIPVDYLDQDGSMKNCPAAQEVTQAVRTLSDGWYVVQGDVTIPDNITVTGDVKLILADNYTLTVEGSIVVNTGNTFTVYAQSTDIDKMGKLNVITNTFDYAAIGGGSGNDAGTVNIIGGNINASRINNSGSGAGIGGANGKVGGTVNIYGGMVDTASYSGAGIGGGLNDQGTTVNIYGGNVKACSHSGAAIGSGESGQGGTVTISGGNVTAKSLGTGAAIGGGEGGQGGTVTISDGIVDAYSVYGAAIGSGKSGNGATVNISGGTVTASNTYNNDAVNGTVTISPAGQAIKVLAGNSESDNQQLEGSPFTEGNKITSLLAGKHWFHSEVTSIQLVTGITLDPTTLTLKLGDTTTATLTATVAPANATNPALRWASNNDAVVTVDAGTTRMSGAVIITAKAPGTAVIIAEATDGSGVKASCTVTVEAAPVSTETPAPTKAPSPTEVPSPTEAPDSTTSSNNSTSSVSATPTATPVPVAQNHTVSTAATAIPQTGDESNPALWLGLLAVSALALGGLAFYKYKHRK